MEDRGVGLVEIGRSGGGEPQRSRFEIGAGAQGESGSFDAEGRRVLVMGCDRPRSLPAPGTEEAVDLGPVKSSIGDVPRCTQDSSHVEIVLAAEPGPRPPRMQYATGWRRAPRRGSVPTRSRLQSVRRVG